MCFGPFASKPPVDNSAAVARQQEQARNARITEGQGKIDEQFGVFDPSFFGNFQNDYLNYYNPQVDEQFADTRKNLRYDLARKGTLNSTPGQNKFADLIDAYQSRRDEVASNALSATNQLKGDVENTKSELYAQNQQSADPSLAAQSAVSRVGALSTTPTYSPLADLFSGIINTGAAYAGGRQQGLPPGYSELFNPGSTSTRAARVVK